MRAFEISVSGKRLCKAGIGNEGVLVTTIRYVTRRGRVKGWSWDALGLEVGGLISATQEHLRWRNIRLKVGDEVLVKIIEADSVDKPTRRYRIDPVVERRAKQRNVREMAKELGWKATAGRSRAN